MDHKLTNAERLARIETILELQGAGLERSGQRAEEILHVMLEKIDLLDAKLEARFNKVENEALDDARELAALKNKGAGVLAALGVVFTATATIFSDFFSALKHLLFG